MPGIDEIVVFLAAVGKLYGAGVLKSAQSKAGDATVDLARRMLSKLWDRAEDTGSLERAVDGLAEGRSEGLAEQIRAIVSKHPDLALELAGMVPPHQLDSRKVPVPFIGREDYLRELDEALAKSLPALPAASARTAVPWRRRSMTVSSRSRHAAASSSDGEWRPSSSPVVLVLGMAGVGKTGLALHWGCSTRTREQFPGGQLFVDLRSYASADYDADDDAPSAASAVLGHWLQSVFGVGKIPDDEQDRGELFQRKLEGRRMLVVLDNAVSENQIRDLLDHIRSCFVVVTSRSSFPGLLADGAHLVRLETLQPDEAADLIATMIGDRADADPAAVRRLAQLCDYLVLALRAVAGLANHNSARALARMVKDLEDEERRLERMRIAGTLPYDVLSSLSLSYIQLPDEETRRVFRLLGLHPVPGGTTDAYAVACLAGIDLSTAERLLEALRARHMIEEVPGPDVRFRLHDLMRLYAKGLMGESEHRAERRAALERLAEAYYGCVNHAFNLMNSGNLMVDAAALQAWQGRGEAGVRAVGADRKRALEWFERERENLVALVRSAERQDPPLAITSRLACSLFYFLEVGGHLEQWKEVEEIAEKTLEYGERRDEARSLRNRGRLAMVHILDAYERLHDSDDPPPSSPGACNVAIGLLEESRDLYRGLRDRSGEATALRELADARRLEIEAVVRLRGSETTKPKPDEALVRAAVHAYQEALEVYDALDSENGKASLQLALGRTYLLAGQATMAEDCFTKTLTYADPQPGLAGGRGPHPRLKAFLLVRFGDLYYSQGKYQQAAEHYRRAATTFEAEVNIDQTALARARALQGRALGECRDARGAVASLTAAAKIFEQQGRAKDDPEVRVVARWTARYRKADRRSPYRRRWVRRRRR